MCGEDTKDEKRNFYYGNSGGGAGCAVQLRLGAGGAAGGAGRRNAGGLCQRYGKGLERGQALLQNRPARYPEKAGLSGAGGCSRRGGLVGALRPDPGGGGGQLSVPDGGDGHRLAHHQRIDLHPGKRGGAGRPGAGLFTQAVDASEGHR